MTVGLGQRPPQNKLNIFSEFKHIISDAMKKIDEYDSLPKSAYELEVLKK